MIAKKREQIKARHLRRKGKSLKEISLILRVAKSSASNWVRDIKLTKPQIRFLAHKSLLKEIINRRVETRLKNERQRRQKIMDSYKKELGGLRLSTNHLLLIGTCLYWAGGGKADSNRIFRFSNSDPEMIRVIMTFLRKVLNVPEKRFKGHVHLHPHLNKKVAERYWSKLSRIPLKQFHKTSQQHNKASKNTRDTLPYGTFNIGVYSTDLYLKMLAWTEVIKNNVLKKYGDKI